MRIPYKASGHARHRPDDANAFVPDTVGEVRPLRAVDAESDAEEFIEAATMGEYVREDALNEVVDEEDGGPFIMLDEDAMLPPVPEERRLDREGHEPLEKEHMRRGGRWAARG
jgi:hypothetical protein